MTRGFAAALVVVVLTGPALAQSALPGGLGAGDSGKPIGIEAENGIEWQQDNHVYIARGNAKATRGEETVIADTLYAYYRPVAAPPRAPAPAQAGKGGAGDPLSGGATEIYRLEADGNVRFTTPSQSMTGDHGIYDVDRQTLVVTGNHLRLVTPRDIITARDSLEWYDGTQTGVARGNALAVRADRRVRGDVLTAIMTKPPAGGGSAHISRINANGNVVLSTAEQIARGDAGVYNLDTGIATLAGHVRLTRGDNELRGRYAVVDTNTNVSRLLSAPPNTQLAGGRVEGLLVPRRKPQAPGQ